MKKIAFSLNSINKVSKNKESMMDNISNVSLISESSINLKDKLNLMLDFDFKGNIKPHAWFNHIRFPNGKPDPIAMDLLADIVYWYRPKIIREESTGKVIGIKKKFKADKLQRSVVAFSDQFGFSVRQVSDALGRLEYLGLIAREYRTIKTKLGKIPHVLFIDIDALAIVKISRLDANLLPDEEEKEDDYFIPFSAEEVNAWSRHASALHDVSPLNVEGLAFKRKTSCHTGATYTEITTQNTTTASNDEKEGNLSETTEKIDAVAVNKKLKCTLPSPLSSDVYLGDVLTATQIAYVIQSMDLLAKDNVNTSTLTEEILAGLIDFSCFSKCGRDFYRKLRAILNAVHRGQWTPPMHFMEQQKKVAEEKEQQEKNDWKGLCFEFEDVAEKSFELASHLKKMIPESSEYQTLYTEWDKLILLRNQLEKRIRTQLPAEKIQIFYKKLQDKFNVN